MNISTDIIIAAVKKAFESNDIKSIQGVNIDDLVKSIADSVIKAIGESADIENISQGLVKGLKSAFSKEK